MNESNSGVNSKNSFCQECGSELQRINVFIAQKMNFTEYLFQCCIMGIYQMNVPTFQYIVHDNNENKVNI